MSYLAYLKTTRAPLTWRFVVFVRMADATGGEFVSLAGGCYGVMLPVDGARLFLARCPDMGADPSYAEWGAWLEDHDGERISGEFSVSIGLIRPRDYPSAPELALRTLYPRFCGTGVRT